MQYSAVARRATWRQHFRHQMNVHALALLEMHSYVQPNRQGLNPPPCETMLASQACTAPALRSVPSSCRMLRRLTRSASVRESKLPREVQAAPTPLNGPRVCSWVQARSEVWGGIYWGGLRASGRRAPPASGGLLRRGGPLSPALSDASIQEETIVQKALARPPHAAGGSPPRAPVPDQRGPPWRGGSRAHPACSSKINRLQLPREAAWGGE